MRISDEHMRLLERAHNNIGSEYTPRCTPAPYGNGCPGADDESVEFWRRAADAVPAMLAEIRERRAQDLTAEEREALRAFVKSPYIVKTERVDCSDPQCGDSTWDHYCDVHDREIPEVEHALSVLSKLLGAAQEER